MKQNVDVSCSEFRWTYLQKGLSIYVQWLWEQFRSWTTRKMHDSQGYFFPGLSWTLNFNFQDFPGGMGTSRMSASTLCWYLHSRLETYLRQWFWLHVKLEKNRTMSVQCRLIMRPSTTLDLLKWKLAHQAWSSVVQLQSKRLKKKLGKKRTGLT